jgi:hypothetical protein
MFTKLLKQEWKATFKLMGIMSLAALGISVLEAVIFRMLLGNIGSAVSGIIGGTLASLILFLTLAIAAYAIGVQIYLDVRFYKNKFSDEGYLTFTLPVSCHQIFLSSMLNMTIWTVLSGAVTALCIGIVVFGGTSGVIDARIWKQLWQGIVSGFQENAEIFGGGYWPLMIISGILGLFSGPILTMTAFTLGAVIAKKHKVLAALGMAYAISMVTSIATTILMNIIGVDAMVTSVDQLTQTLQISYYIQVFMQLAMMIGGYILSVWLMKNKLNLT